MNVAKIGGSLVIRDFELDDAGDVVATLKLNNQVRRNKGPFIVWLFFTLYFAIPILLSNGSSTGSLPQSVTISLKWYDSFESLR